MSSDHTCCSLATLLASGNASFDLRREATLIPQNDHAHSAGRTGQFGANDLESTRSRPQMPGAPTKRKSGTPDEEPVGDDAHNYIVRLLVNERLHRSRGFGGVEGVHGLRKRTGTRRHPLTKAMVPEADRIDSKLTSGERCQLEDRFRHTEYDS